MAVEEILLPNPCPLGWRHEIFCVLSYLRARFSELLPKSLYKNSNHHCVWVIANTPLITVKRKKPMKHTFYFWGFVILVILLSLLSSYVVFVLKVAWLAHVTLRKNNKTQAAVAPLYFGSRHAHNTRKESTDSSRRNVAGAILYCHRYKRSYGWVHRWGSFYFSWHGDENDRCSRYPGKQLWNR